MTELEKSYLAGLFDGEGSVSFTTYCSKGKRYNKLQAKISQNQREVLDWVCAITGVGSVHKCKRRSVTGFYCHDYVVAHESARRFLREIRPYLKVKGTAVDAKLADDAKKVKRQSAAVTRHDLREIEVSLN